MMAYYIGCIGALVSLPKHIWIKLLRLCVSSRRRTNEFAKEGNMTVWIIIGSFDYEEDTVLEVWTTEAHARAQAEIFEREGYQNPAGFLQHFHRIFVEEHEVHG